MALILNEKPKPPKPQRSFQKINTPNTKYLTNGTIANFAIPCWYKEIRKPIKRHHPDRHRCWFFLSGCCACGEHHHFPHHNHIHHGNDRHCKQCHQYLDMDCVIPIHLLSDSEYGPNAEVTVSFEKKSDGTPKLPGLTCTEAWINTTKRDGQNYSDDWTIRFKLKAECPSAELEEQETHFTIRIKNATMNDPVAVGKIKVLPAIL